MRFAQGSSLAVAASVLLSSSFVTAQTSTKCNPLTSQCPADPALGRSVSTDFTSGQSSDYTASGSSITYGSDGAQMSITKQGDSPLLASNWYLMFGHVEIVMKAAPGTGIVTSAVLQSNDLDEIDWEMLGSDPSQIQTNYFGKGQTGSYDRGTFVPDSTSQSQFNTYTIDWTATQIVWQINGQTVRTLQPSQAPGQYPQTPMQIKIGPWAGGDPSNQPGVQAWAGGQTTYDQTYSMYVKSISAQDYSTGQSYQYSGTDGTWQQVKSDSGSVSSGGTAVDTSAPATTSTTSGQPVPFSGTHAEPKSSQPNPSIYPWVAGGSMTTSSISAATSIPGLPAGWTVSDSGKVVPPSSAASTYPAVSSTQSSVSSASATSQVQGGDGPVAGVASPVVTPQPTYGSPATSSGFVAVATGNFTRPAATPVSTPAVVYKGDASGRTCGSMVASAMVLVAFAAMAL